MRTKFAAYLLGNSVNDLIKRIQNISIDEVEMEIINLATLEILKQEKRINCGDILISKETVIEKFMQPIVSSFQNAAFELWPKYYSTSNAESSTKQIYANLLKQETWKKLEQYYMQKHDRNINEDVFEPEYDKFEAGVGVELFPFTFISNYYKIWSAGELVDFGNDSTEVEIVSLKKDIFTNMAKLKIDISSTWLNKKMPLNLLFDVGYYGVNRVIAATIPTSTNIENYDPFIIFRKFAGFKTRNNKVFSDNEPFASSIFFKDSSIKKITFSIAASDKLIELYGE